LLYGSTISGRSKAPLLFETYEKELAILDKFKLEEVLRQALLFRAGRKPQNGLLPLTNKAYYSFDDSVW
jgi:hypothetical protein